MATIRRIVAYKIFINKQIKHTNVTIRLALYIFYNTVHSRLDSSQGRPQDFLQGGAAYGS